MKIGNYILEEPLGRGGAGVVYKGRHAKLPRAVAVKSIAARGRRDLRGLRLRFEREAYVQSQLDHPGVVKIYDYIVAEQTYYIVMEYVEGQSLAALLEAWPRPPDLARSLDLFEQILSAVAYAHTFTYRDEQGAPHRGIIHRDLKPHNILVTPDGRVKVADFGVVKLVGGEDETNETSGTVYGSPLYVSPEQAEGARVDRRSDIYSLGVILYELLTGVAPFGGGDVKLTRTEVLRAHLERKPRPPSEINPAVPEELERAACRALEKKPERRFASVFDFWREVRRARGRDASDIDEQEQHASQTPENVRGPTEELGNASGATRAFAGATSDLYLTQPINAPRCEACGARGEEGDRRCRRCGQDLAASRATSELMRRAMSARQKRGLRMLVLFCALAAAAVAVVSIYMSRGASPAGESTRPASSESSDTSPPASDSSPASVPADENHAALVELRPSRVRVDSSYDGYAAEPLTDGVIDVRRIAAMRYNRGNWVSDETPVPHWVEVEFERPERVSAVYVFWGFDRGRFMPSRRVELQTPDASGEWRTVATLRPGGDYDRAAFEFAPAETSRVRILQPAQQGPASRPFVMWLREVRVYAAAPDS